MQRIGNYLDNNLIVILIRKLVEIFITVAFIILILVVFGQVIARYVFNNSFSWSEELARYLQVWIILLGSSICCRKGTHIAIDFAIQKLPYICKKIIKLITFLFMMFYLVILTLNGFKIVSVIYAQFSPAIHIPMRLVYLAVPIGCGLMFFETLILFFKLGWLNKNESTLNFHSK